MQSYFEKNLVISMGDLIIDQRSYTVESGKTRTFLHSREMRLLCLLVRHPGWIFTKEEIYESIYEKEMSININNSIYCLVRSLRKKIEENPQHPKYIKTIRGVGYKFELPRE